MTASLLIWCLESSFIQWMDEWTIGNNIFGMGKLELLYSAMVLYSVDQTVTKITINL